MMFALLFIWRPVKAADRQDEIPSGIISRIKRQPAISSALASIGYSKRLHALEIEFRNGAIYRYLEVSPGIYRDLLASESKARFYDENIRGRYRSLHVRTRESE